MEGHICTCPGCEIAPYVDRCKFELVTRAAVARAVLDGAADEGWELTEAGERCVDRAIAAALEHVIEGL